MSTESLSVDKSESVAAVASNSESVAPSVKAATAAQKKTKKSKTKVKAVVAAVAAAQELTEAESISNLTVDHPYLSVLYKRIRSHRKKLEKIKSLELAQLEEGKKPNAQQLELMGSKSTLEKLVAELEMLREQFVGVYTEEMEKKKAVEAEEETTAPVKPVEEKEESETIAEQEELTPEGEQETQEVQETAQQVVEDKEQDFARVFELLKTLHVVNLHQALGKEVPMVLDFFSKVLLGNTRPPAELSYEENLMESLEEAKKYLTASDKLFACDTTYSGLRTLVDQLADMSSPQADEEEVEEAAEEAAEDVHEAAAEETSDVPVVPAEINTMPQISFFTESQLEEEAEQTEVTAQVPEVEKEPVESSDVQIEQVQEETTSSPESVPAAPLSFAAVTAGVTSERTPSPSASSGSSGNDKKESDNSPQKSSRRRGQGRWREKNSNSNSGNKSGSPTNGGKPRRPRAPRTNDENSNVQGGKRSGSKENRRPRVDRTLRKQPNSTQHSTPMIAPHA
ncbi:hypothetical protein GN244_ATG14347 [Phytophthora infestans]|uniref:Uncharacterized protein n=1 Tax=Phytophthora infestans TaxID=4787 RepID=A0A833SHR2_PHYIN|nr:hypothetical protein GN244_ATG14347 [Phytophthora infestans]KAF4146090.1 hypothetical protein GN958_ATG04756 [Phytophthora infestans]